MSYEVKIKYSDGTENTLENTFDTKDEAEEAALYELSCYSLGAELLEMMGGEEDDIDYSSPEYEIAEK